MSTPTSATSATSAGERDDAAPAGDPSLDAFDPTLPWRLNPKVALRPEPFGALLYHFGTRKLSFLKNLTVVGIVEALADADSADAALAAADIAGADRQLYLQALTSLAASGMIVRR